MKSLVTVLLTRAALHMRQRFADIEEELLGLGLSRGVDGLIRPVVPAQVTQVILVSMGIWGKQRVWSGGE